MKPTLLALALLAAALAGCGSSPEKPAPPAATPTPRAIATADLSGYSAGVQRYYGGIPAQAPSDPEAATEAEYNKPPDPAEAPLGGTITLTGTNIGVRLKVTVAGVERIGSHTAIQLHLVNDGIAVYQSDLTQASVTYGDGKPLPPAKGAKAPCTKRTQPALRLDVSRRADVCLLFPASGNAKPDRFQLALETVPTAAGGIWNLR